MEIVAFLVLYTGGVYRYFFGPFELSKIQGWPTDGVQIGLIFFSDEWAPGKPNRQIMMGNDSYFYVPSTRVVGHSDESAGQIRQRYGNDTLIWKGQWTTHTEIQKLSQVAVACDSLDKLTPEWLEAALI